MMYSLDEATIIPAPISHVSSRSDVIPFIDGKLPIFVAPMTSVLNEDNFKTFNSRTFAIHPVTCTHCNPDDWYAVTLSEFETTANGPDLYHPDSPQKICIDIANGHMQKLYDLVFKYKQKFPQDIVMVGNIANPETFYEAVRVGADFVRVGIGGGSACTTSVLTGVHASLPWLLSGINAVKKEHPEVKKWPKIVADGGINTIAKFVKALAMGADYVMMGKLFAQCNESAAYVDKSGFKVYYGMSSPLGKADCGKDIHRNVEGAVCHVESKWFYNQLCDRLEEALRSAMSYTDSFTLDEFKHARVQWQTQSEFESFSKGKVA